MIQETYQAIKGLTTLFATVNVGAAGAVTLQSWNPATTKYVAAPTGATGNFSILANGSAGISTVTKNGTAGNWTTLFQYPFTRCISVTATVLGAGGSLSTAVAGIQLISSSIATNPNTFSVVTQIFNNIGAGNVAADPASGDQVTLCFLLQNSSAI